MRLHSNNNAMLVGCICAVCFPVGCSCMYFHSLDTICCPVGALSERRVVTVMTHMRNAATDVVVKAIRSDVNEI